MPTYRISASLERKSGLPEDRVVNTFYFKDNVLPPNQEATITAAENAVKDFYNGVTGTNTNVAAYISNIIKAGAVHVLKTYVAGLAAPNPPIRESFFTLLNNNGQPAPADVALCLSYRGSLEQGLDPKNRRGRLYIGPLSLGSIQTSANGSDALPNEALRIAMREAAKRLLDLTSIRWQLWSPTTLNFVDLTHAWIDDQFDTQRRRGVKPTSRLTADRTSSP